ncbi:HXXEE domain-containing protein, partial [Candidatus Saccharibacteria bacterium]
MDKHGVKPNRYFQFWLPVIGLHMLHQVEESISFFQWYVDHAAEIPGWLSIPIANYDARMSIEHPEYFIFLTLGQLFLVSSAAFLSRRNEKATKILLLLYIAGLAFFLVWH